MKGFVYQISLLQIFIKIYHEKKKLYAFEVSIISFMEAAIFVFYDVIASLLYICKNETNKI